MKQSWRTRLSVMRWACVYGQRYRSSRCDISLQGSWCCRLFVPLQQRLPHGVRHLRCLRLPLAKTTPSESSTSCARRRARRTLTQRTLQTLATVGKGSRRSSANRLLSPCTVHTEDVWSFSFSVPPAEEVCHQRASPQLSPGLITACSPLRILEKQLQETCHAAVFNPASGACHLYANCALVYLAVCS